MKQTVKSIHDFLFSLPGIELCFSEHDKHLRQIISRYVDGLESDSIDRLIYQDLPEKDYLLYIVKNSEFRPAVFPTVYLIEEASDEKEDLLVIGVRIDFTKRTRPEE